MVHFWTARVLSKKKSVENIRVMKEELVCNEKGHPRLSEMAALLGSEARNT